MKTIREILWLLPFLFCCYLYSYFHFLIGLWVIVIYYPIKKVETLQQKRKYVDACVFFVFLMFMLIYSHCYSFHLFYSEESAIRLKFLGNIDIKFCFLVAVLAYSIKKVSKKINDNLFGEERESEEP